MRLSRSFLFPFFLFHIGANLAIVVNRTIDDYFGDPATGKAPIYAPPAVWAGPECQGCAINPDPKQAFNGTWTAATYQQKFEHGISIHLSFKGIAIYVFFIVPNYIESPITTETVCNFTLDGQLVGTFNHSASGKPDFLYNVPVFSHTGLSNVDHTLLISTSGIDRHIFVSFDYAIYTFDDTPPQTEAPPLTSGVTMITSSLTRPSIDVPSSSATATKPSGTVSVPGTTTQTRSVHKINVKAIVGSVIGGVAGLLILIGIVRWAHLHQARTGLKMGTRAIVGSVFSGVMNLLHYCRKRSMATKVSTDHYAPTPFLLDGGPANGSGVPMPKSISTPAQHTILDTRTDLVQPEILHPTSRNHDRESMLQAYPSSNTNAGARAIAVNRTIDDTLGDSVTGKAPKYSPPDVWAGPECPGCVIKPDTKNAFHGTWKAATYHRELEHGISIQLSFKGIAIYVFFIIPDYIEDHITTETACNFTLDGQLVRTFSHVPTSDTIGFLYNVPVFSQTGLPNVDHTLLISTSGVDRHIFVSFDYAIYTFDDTPPQTEAPPSSSGTTITSFFSSPSIVSPSVIPSSDVPSSAVPSNAVPSIAVPSSAVLWSVVPSSSATATKPSATVSIPDATTQIGSIHKTNVNAIVGGVIGGVAGLLVLVLIVIVRWDRLFRGRVGGFRDSQSSFMGGMADKRPEVQTAIFPHPSNPKVLPTYGSLHLAPTFSPSTAFGGTHYATIEKSGSDREEVAAEHGYGHGLGVAGPFKHDIKSEVEPTRPRRNDNEVGLAALREEMRSLEDEYLMTKQQLEKD
ncbi:hypothetical protein D9615_001527 [Tricholomella constricta]|uniref:Uncharacterized protein n=1 Tax=Tricholomella constricta TaxID=117010 RepID=A0A8H5MA98_9AGAR|nr:hypothetical protein D9615_001527 [Tricholomella constricta]